MRSIRIGQRVARVGSLALVLFAVPLSPARGMPPEDARAWREDLRFMASEMELMHKNLYHSVSRETFASMIQALDERIPALQRHEVIVEMARIVAAVGDGHTNIYPTRDSRIGFHTLPVAFTFFGDELAVRAAREPQRKLLGAAVIRIGDQDVAGAYAAVRDLIGRDNEQGARYWAPFLLAMPEVLHALRITRSPDEVPLTVETGAGPDSVVLRPFGPVEIMTGDIATLFDRREGWIDVRDLSGKPDPLWLRGGGRAFWIERSRDLLYAQINMVGDAPDETFAAFAARLRREIGEMRPRKVALDLRLNRGGDGTLIVPLVRSLIQSEEIDRPGRLFAIIGPATFSAAQMLVDALEKYTNVTFVGEPTSSKGNVYGDSRKIMLPNSGITVRVSIYYWQDWHPADDRAATLPGIPAVLTLDAYSNQLDPALEAIRRATEKAAPAPER
jgi:hypothetical protein